MSTAVAIAATATSSSAMMCRYFISPWVIWMIKMTPTTTNPMSANHFSPTIDHSLRMEPAAPVMQRVIR